ncbi:uncharacterized protein K452DRAFT_315524 [Aplosporella prunicola CBS 121167]|uniref:Cenp-O kinetochore centromere component n=1 Tax=Aplosporella prunicola CBS 121167 TaxID=1176127 RepID=A0A6A6BU47_9PEZI|nr:uncharacterized protein K452DRAFT_315524 [Aplosporella prunicola CBS 121167]KAF2146327.1 hypothetical protein K452DRAFT_315524 [Aplosporella prunicola CBS 121167]
MSDSLIPDSQVDNEIAYLREQIQSLERRRSALSSTLLSSRHTLTRIQRAKAKATSTASPAATALDVVQKQQKHNLENLHRTCAGITAFRVKDPDPHALDDGKVLGVRIDISIEGRFVTPYYLLLNRPQPSSEALRIHKHTIPPSIPLQSLAAKYLPQPTPAPADGAPAKPNRAQNLHRLVRELHKELVSHHLRLNAVSQLRKDAGLPEDTTDDAAGRKRAGKFGIANIKALDVGAEEVEITWADKSTARVRVTKNGAIEKVVVRTPDGASRKRDVERRISGEDGRVEGIVQRLAKQ